MQVSLEDHGFPDRVLSPGVYPMKIDEIEVLFVDAFQSDSRKVLIEQVRSLIARINEYANISRIFIDGSFVTGRIEPSDIDIAIWLDRGSLPQTNSDEFARLAQLLENAPIAFNCDLHWAIESTEGDHAFPAFRYQRDLVRRLFSAYKDDNGGIYDAEVKGYIELVV